MHRHPSPSPLTRGDLTDWLPEHVFKITEGNMRPPVNRQERAEDGFASDWHTTAEQAVRQRHDRRRAGSGQRSFWQRLDLLDRLRQRRRAGLCEQGKAISETGGLNLAHLTDEQQIEAEDDYRMCVRRGSTEEAKPKKKQRRIEAAKRTCRKV